MRDSYIWNTLSASIYAMQSAIVLIVITHVTGLEDAGIFSIAYAVASLMYYIGEYGVRKYQVSDINEEMTFTDYHSHRIVACTIMLAVSLLYVANGFFRLGYSPYKAYIVLVICLTKVVEAYSDIFGGILRKIPAGRQTGCVGEDQFLQDHARRHRLHHRAYHHARHGNLHDGMARAFRRSPSDIEHPGIQGFRYYRAEVQVG